MQASAKIWESSGFKVTLFEDVQRMVWEKLIMNVTFSGTTCATGLTIGEVMADPNAWGVALSCAKEAIAVADAIGVKMEVGNPIEHIKELGSGGKPAVCSKADKDLSFHCSAAIRTPGFRETPHLGFNPADTAI